MQKNITRHVFSEYLEEAEHLRHTLENKMIYKARKETIERVFADLKEKQGLRYTRLRGIRNLKRQALLAFACHNLRKLAKRVWKTRRISSILIHLIIENIKKSSFRSEKTIFSTD